MSEVIADLRHKSLSRDAIHGHLMERGLTYDEAEEAVDGDGTYTGNAPGTPTADNDLRGLGAWLVLHAVGLPLQLLVLVHGLWAFLPLGRLWPSLIPQAKRILAVQLAALLLLLFITVIALIRFYSHDRRAPRAMIVMIGANLAYAVLGNVDTNTNLPATIEPRRADIAAVAALVWGLYFLLSRRVRRHESRGVDGPSPGA